MRVPIVGVGASAGGLEAFIDFLTHLPVNTGMAFVLIQHLDPKHKSHLPELLSSATRMPVTEVKGKTQIEANHVYLIAAGHQLVIRGEFLFAPQRSASGQSKPVDSFLTGLAKERGQQACGVILSGTGSDGTLGLQAIRAAKGVTFAQQLESAKFTEMPGTAITQGVVDFVLTPARIGAQLTRMSSLGAASRRRNGEARASAPETEPETEPDLLKIFALLRSASGVDFMHYKHNTILRRIHRRMAMQGFKTLKEYTVELSRSPDEAHSLCQDFFITVSGFFRDTGVFQELKKMVFPALLAKRAGGQHPLRIWVPGCATGEEAYSIAICLTEFLDDAGIRQTFQIFATDASEAVIEKARSGIYNEASMASVSPKRRARFFTSTDRHYRINKTIRDRCIFAQQNLARDPPFSRIDVISCCNVLIYLGAVLQRRIVPVFHYALRADGYLILGASESIGAFGELFQQVSKKNKIYRRQSARGNVLAALRQAPDEIGRWDFRTPKAVRSLSPAAPPASVGVQRTRAGQWDPAALRKELATTKKYLRTLVAGKEAALQELKSLNEEAQAGNEELETAQEELQSVNEELSTLNEDLRQHNSQAGQLNLDLTNLQESIHIPLVMVGKDLRIRRFTRAMMPLLNLTPSDVGRPVTDLRPEMDLPDLRQRLLSVTTGGKPLQLEVQDAHGCWYLLRIRPAVGPNGATEGAVLMLIDIDAQKRGRDFAEAIVEAVHEPLLILRKNLKVVSANRAFYSVFRVTPEDTVGRQIYDLGEGQWNIPRLRELLQQILPAHSTFRDFEVQHDFEHLGLKVMLLNASEVFDASAKEQSILLAIEDITERKRSEEVLQNMNVELQHFAYALTHDLREPLRMVVNFTELLAQEYHGKLSAEADQYIDYSVEGARRMEALMKALLSYWETTSLDHSDASTDCNVALQKTLRYLSAAIAESGATVTSDLLPTVLAEEAMLTQVFQNLIGNSIKYKDGAPPRVHVTAENAGLSWLFAVRDNGLGIDPAYAQRIFGIFKRLHGKEIPGTGIGLALCKKIIERRGGKIWVESALGHGATFKFTIPMAVNGA